MCKSSDVTRVMPTRFPAIVIVWGVMSNHVIPLHIFPQGIRINAGYVEILDISSDHDGLSTHWTDISVSIILT